MNLMTSKKIKMEKMSSAVTLSDMEIFIFPDLMIAGALANLMSPLIWEWKKDPWFLNMEKLSPYQRVLKVKQYIIDHYVFNLDLETWGLTKKEQERARFSDLVDFSQVEASNALMGYEGDRYYYDIDIRRHFGLDHYTAEDIPYWKTETVEAMNAFRLKPGYKTGAGECVSLSMLYFAALHIVAGIPLDKMYMMATPLHSQNLIDLGEGILTNNRRIVTKSMWNNGTSISQKARRALVNEKVTIMANLDGYVHTMYDTSTMPKEEYQKFQAVLKSYLRPEINADLFYAFLRQNEKWQPYFYFSARDKQTLHFLEAEILYQMEAEGNLKLAAQSIQKLMRQAEKTKEEPLADRFPIQSLEDKDYARLHFESREEWPAIIAQWMPMLSKEEADALAEDFLAFTFVVPRLPSLEKDFASVSGPFAGLEECDSSTAVISYLDGLRGKKDIADLAFMAFRDLTRSPWCPFLRAALERNPVSQKGMRQMCSDEVYRTLFSFGAESIYSQHRLAQPDEVFNFQTGDGLEKAICLWNVLWARGEANCFSLVITAKDAYLRVDGREFVFSTQKGLPEQVVFFEDAPVCASEHRERFVAAL